MKLIYQYMGVGLLTTGLFLSFCINDLEGRETSLQYGQEVRVQGLLQEMVEPVETREEARERLSALYSGVRGEISGHYERNSLTITSVSAYLNRLKDIIRECDVLGIELEGLREVVSELEGVRIRMEILDLIHSREKISGNLASKTYEELVGIVNVVSMMVDEVEESSDEYELLNSLYHSSYNFLRWKLCERLMQHIVSGSSGKDNLKWVKDYLSSRSTGMGETVEQLNTFMAYIDTIVVVGERTVQAKVRLMKILKAIITSKLSSRLEAKRRAAAVKKKPLGRTMRKSVSCNIVPGGVRSVAAVRS